MAVRNCPECGHELSGRGRYCIFCGCDLRKARPLKAAESAPVVPAETASVRKSRPAFLAVLLAVAAVLAALAAYTGTVSRKPESPPFRAGMSFEEAAQVMERCGYVCRGEPLREENDTRQDYEGCTVYGYDTRYSVLKVTEGDNPRIVLTHYYADKNWSAGGESFMMRNLKQAMTGLYGKPEFLKSVVDYYNWPAKDGSYMLYSLAGSIIAVRWLEE